jgi:hypothetical protein
MASAAAADATVTAKKKEEDDHGSLDAQMRQLIIDSCDLGEEGLKAMRSTRVDTGTTGPGG